MKKSLNLLISLFLVTMVTIGVLSGWCSDALGAGEKKPVLLGAPPTTWRAYTRAVATSDLVNRTTDLDITVRSYSGNMSALTGLITGEADFAATQGDATVGQAYGGFGDFGGKPPAKSLRMAIIPLLYKSSLVATKSSDIKTIHELKGKKVAWFAAEPNNFLEGILGAYGFDLEKDMKLVRIQGAPKALGEMKMRRIDACVSPVVSTPAVLDYFETRGPLVVLPIGLQKFKLAKEKYPKKMIGIAPTLLKPGHEEFLETKEPTYVAAQPTGIVTRNDISADIVYTYVKAWLNNINEIKGFGAGLNNFGPEVFQMPSAIPYHQGAIKALKEANFWTKEMDQAHSLALKK